LVFLKIIFFKDIDSGDVGSPFPLLLNQYFLKQAYYENQSRYRK
jgi:hypothetical protein